MNNYKLIKLLSDIIIVSDEEIKNGDLVIASYYEESYYIIRTLDIHIGNVEHGQQMMFNIDGMTHEIRFCKKIIASSNISHNLPSIILPDEIAEKIGWIDVEKEYIKYCYKEALNKYPTDKIDFIAGFNKSQSLNTNKYSFEDLKDAILYGHKHKEPIISLQDSIDFINSLNKPKERNVIGTLENNTFKVIEIL